MLWPTFHKPVTSCSRRWAVVTSSLQNDPLSPPIVLAGKFLRSVHMDQRIFPSPLPSRFVFLVAINRGKYAPVFKHFAFIFCR